VTVLEKNPDIGAKIRISGGGRCNFTNISHNLPVSYHSSGSRGSVPEEPGGESAFVRGVLARYPPGEFIELVESNGVGYHEKKLGQLFSDGKSPEAAGRIVEMLRRECHNAGVEIRTNCTVTGISRADGSADDPEGARFFVDCEGGGGESRGSPYRVPASSVVVASGGLSFAKSCGSTDLSHRIAASFGLRVHGVRPGLVPLVWREGDAEWAKDLSGVSMEVRATVRAASFLENMLFTHRGVSGPVVLQISSYWDQAGGEPVAFDLVPDAEEEKLLQWLRKEHKSKRNAEARCLVRQLFTERFADVFWQEYGATALGVAPEAKLRDVPQMQLRHLAALLKRWEMHFGGTEGYPKAEVTCGGLAIEALCPDTLEALEQPGLYFVGEAVDVTGWLGGYNFQWAWSSGYTAGIAC